MTARVTVTIPTYNRSGLLRRTIDSVLAQTFTDFEVIVADNGSTDDTTEVVRSYDDPRVQYDRLPDNAGMLGNLNRCLRLGEAPYMMMVHDDDLIRPGYLAAAVAMLDEHPEVVFVHSAFSVIDGDDNITVECMASGEPIDPMEPPEVYITRCFLRNNRLSPSGTLVRRTAVADEHFEEADGAGNDMGMWLRVARKGVVAFLPDANVAWRIHNARVTSQMAMGALGGKDEYLKTIEGIAMLRRVKMRFAERFDGDPVSAQTLRRLARRQTRAELGTVLRDQVLAAGSTSDRTALCRRALAIEPTVVLSADTAEALAKTALGDPGLRAAAAVRSMARRLRERIPRSTSL